MNELQKSRILANRIKSASAHLQEASRPDTPVSFVCDVALLVIDVQKEYCDPRGSRGNRQTEEISQRIQAITPEFRAAKVPVYAIHFDWTLKKKKTKEIDFHHFIPEKDDILVGKCTDSAFQSGPAKSLFRDHGRKLLLACGFNTSACVKSTVMDARREGYDVCLLTDMVGNDSHNPSSPEYAIEEMKKSDVTMTASDIVLKEIKVANANALAPSEALRNTLNRYNAADSNKGFMR